MSIHDISQQLAIAGVKHVVVSSEIDQNISRFDPHPDKHLALMLKTREAIEKADKAVNSGKADNKTFKSMETAQKYVQQLGKVRPIDLSYDSYSDDPSRYRVHLRSLISALTRNR